VKDVLSGVVVILRGPSGRLVGRERVGEMDIRGFGIMVTGEGSDGRNRGSG
jgi:hypothetical protein